MSFIPPNWPFFAACLVLGGCSYDEGPPLATDRHTHHHLHASDVEHEHDHEDFNAGAHEHKHDHSDEPNNDSPSDQPVD